MEKYSLGNSDIEFDTSKIFLLFQILYRLESIKERINSQDSEVKFLNDSLKKFEKIFENNKKGLREFLKFREDAQNKNMWLEYGEYITSFAQISMDELEIKNPEIADAVQQLINTDFFYLVEKLNDRYKEKMKNTFIEQIDKYKKEIENTIGSSKVKKTIFMSFTPQLFNIGPCCLGDKNGNEEYAIEFTIPTDEKMFEEEFGMKYIDGIESMILFHEKLHADLPTQDECNFENSMQRELDSHLKHSIIELIANGEMGMKMANFSTHFQSVFHIGKIPYNGRILLTKDLKSLGMKDNDLLHTEAIETYKGNEEHYTRDEMGIIKIRGMVYPYALMYINKNNEQAIEIVQQEIQRDSQRLKEIYGEDFLEKLQDRTFLKEVQEKVKSYNNLLEFAEGMSEELLGIKQIRVLKRNIDTRTIGKSVLTGSDAVKGEEVEFAEGVMIRDTRSVIRGEQTYE